MAGTTTQTSIINRALQLLGYKPVSSINDNDRGARAMLRAYESVKLSCLREYRWNFAIKRVQLSEDAIGPVFGKRNYFTLPGDFLAFAGSEQRYGVTGGGATLIAPPRSDWQIEGQKIATDDSGPLDLRYVSSDVTEALFDPSFAEAFSAALAFETCEELTQSNSKIQNISRIYDDAINSARRNNAFDNSPVQPATDPWITARF